MDASHLLPEESAPQSMEHLDSHHRDADQDGLTASNVVDNVEESSFIEGDSMETSAAYVVSNEKRNQKRKDYGELAENDDGELYWRAITGSEEAEWQRATYLTAEVRREMIEEMSQLGEYKTKRPIGSGKEDQTCFHPNQKDWGEARSDRPDVLFQYNKPESRGNRTLPDSVPVFIYKGQVVIDQESGKPLRDFPNIPKCLSSAEEGWLFEAISRQDPRISHDDFRDRMPYDVRPDTKTISMRRSRFRWKTACKSWVTRSASDKINEYLDKTVPQIYQSANSTRAWRDLKGHEIKEMKDASLGKFPERARKTNKATDEGDDSKNDRSIRTVHGGRITKNKSASKRPSRSAYATEGVVYSAPYFNSRNAPPATEHTAVASQPSEELGDRSVGHQGHRLEQARPDIEDHQIRGQVVDFRHKAPTNDWEKRAVQRALAPTRFRMAQLLQRPTPPTDESASYIEQYEALQRYYVASLGKIDSLDKPEDLKAYKDAWTECFPRKLFFDDFEMPDTLGDQI